MENLSILEKLDFVLKTIEDNSHPKSSQPDIEYKDLYRKLGNNGFNNANQSDLDLIIEKLLSDKYIKERKSDAIHVDSLGVNKPITESNYFITFEGRLFEGYKQQNDNKKILGKYQDAATVGIIVGGFGGGLAGVYYLLEILDFFSHHSCH